MSLTKEIRGGQSQPWWPTYPVLTACPVDTGAQLSPGEHPNPPPSEEHGPSVSLASGQVSGVIFHFRADAGFKCSLFKVGQKVCGQIWLQTLESLGKQPWLRFLGLSAKLMALYTLQKSSCLGPWCGWSTAQSGGIKGTTHWKKGAGFPK